LTPGAAKRKFATCSPTPEDERDQRADEWRVFRRDYYFTQRELTNQLECSRRTVINIEHGALTYPSVALLRRFHYLQRKFVYEHRREEDVTEASRLEREALEKEGEARASAQLAAQQYRVEALFRR
jgi:DNA-binding XRE family transcriptional regulator